MEPKKSDCKIIVDILLDMRFYYRIYAWRYSMRYKLFELDEPMSDKGVTMQHDYYISIKAWEASALQLHEIPT